MFDRKTYSKPNRLVIYWMSAQVYMHASMVRYRPVFASCVGLRLCAA